MKTCLIAALSLILMACAATTTRIEPARLTEVRKGQTTVAEVVQRFGRPSVLSRNPDGTQSAFYAYNEAPSGGTTIVPLLANVPRDSVTFYFDTKGILTDIKTTQADKPSPAQAKSDKTAPAETAKPAATQAGTGKAAPATPAAPTTTQATARKPAPADSNTFWPGQTNENR